MKAYNILPELNLPDVEINHITSNTTQIQPNTLFFAIKGAKFNPNEHINEIFAQGAEIIITTEKDLADNEKIFFMNPTLETSIDDFSILNENNLLFTALSNFHGIDFDKKKIIAVTGTNGKTTTAWFILQLLQNLNKKAAYIGTLGFFDGNVMHEGIFTTPLPEEFINMVGKLDDEVEYLIIEASSHAGKQSRLGLTKFEALLYTNFTIDHLDYHKTLDEYYKSKLVFVDKVSSNKIYVNGEDNKVVEYFNKYVAKEYQVLFPCLDTHYCCGGISINLDGHEFNTNIIGDFNKCNLLLATKLILDLGFPIEEIKKATMLLTSPDGRLQVRKKANQPTVIIDFAHAPDAMENVLKEAKKIAAGGKVINVFGVTGEREAELKQEMGSVSARFADLTIVTEDNTMGFDWQQIFADIKGNNDFIGVEDRESAIIKAVSLAQPEDVITILGKASENYQYTNIDKKHKKFYKSDAKVVEEILGE